MHELLRERAILKGYHVGGHWGYLQMPGALVDRLLYADQIAGPTLSDDDLG